MALGFSTSVMAAGTAITGLFSIDHNLTIVGGTVTADCPVSSSCTDLPGTGNGLLLRSVTNSAGVDFIQSIVAETLPGGGQFANEQDVRQGISGVQNGANLAQKMVIDDPLEGFSANHTTVTEGFFSTSPSNQNLNGLPIFQLNQTVDLGAGAFSKVRIRGAITTTLFNGTGTFGTVNHGVEDITTTNPYFGPGAREQLGGLKVYVDQIGGVNNPEMGDFIYRYDRTRFSTLNQTLDLPNGLGSVNVGSSVFPGYPPFGFQVNRDAVVYMHQSLTGMQNDFGFLKYGAGVYTFNNPDHLGVWAPTWTPDFVALNGLDGVPISSTNVQTDPALIAGSDAYGTWGTTAQAIFGAINDYTDLDVQTFLP